VVAVFVRTAAVQVLRAVWAAGASNIVGQVAYDGDIVEARSSCGVVGGAQPTAVLCRVSIAHDALDPSLPLWVGGDPAPAPREPGPGRASRRGRCRRRTRQPER